MKLKQLLLLVLLFNYTITKSQHLQHSENELIEKKLQNVQLIFDEDSIRGFNENAARQQAAMSGAPKWEQMMQISYAKRKYINYKYNLGSERNRTIPNPTTQSGCTNVDFELGNASGWTFTEGTNTNSTTMAGCCPSTSTRYSVVSPGSDPTVPALAMVPAGGGNYSLLIGDGPVTGAYAVRAGQSFNVTAANSVFIYRYAAVLEDAGHACTDQPYFNISFTDCSNNPIPCAAYNVVVSSSSCSSGGDPAFQTYGGYKWKDWTTRAFDLSSYIGQCVKIEFTASDCTQGGHAGWAYVDCSCQPMTLSVNGVATPVGQTNNAFCQGVMTNTICAPAGFNYSWTGPGVTGYTTQCVTTTTTNGSYSVTLTQAGSGCFSPVLYSNFVSSPNPTVTNTSSQPSCTNSLGSATISATGGSGSYSYSWSPTAPSTGSVSAGLPPGNYTVTVQDSLGCSGNTMLTITSFSGTPTASLTSVPGNTLTCVTQSIQATATSTVTDAVFTWQLPGSSTSTVNPLPITTPGTYTLVVTNTVTSCSNYNLLTIGSNTTAPSVSVTPTSTLLTCTNNTVSITASSNVTNTGYAWTNAVPANNTATYTVNSGGTYTVVGTDPSNGCTDTAMVSISSNVVLPTAVYTQTCSGSVTQLIGTAVTPTNSTMNWAGPLSPFMGNPATITSTGIYTLTVSNPLTGCQNTYTTSVTDLGGPSASITTAPGNTLTCAVTSIQANLTSTVSGISFTWQPGSSNSNPLSITAPGTYSAIVTSTLNSCVSIVTVAVTSNTVHPVLSIGSTGTVIPCSTNSLALNASSSAAGTTYTWSNTSPANTTSVNTVSSAGTYTVTGTDPLNGCSSTATIAVSHETVTAAFASDSTHGLVPLTVHYTNGSTNATTYSWDFGNGTGSTATNPTNTFDNAGVYTVVLVATNGFCSDTAKEVIQVILVSHLQVPNVFTPNGDGHNDVFELQAMNIGDIHFSVFDRWGLKMFETTTSGNVKWDGKNKGGSTVTDGTYFYILNATGLDNKSYDLQGTISVFK